MKSPAFQFYPADYLSSQRVQMMTLEEEGAYIRLLCYCWLHGTIPSDLDMIARIIGKGGSTTLARVVQAMFNQHPTDPSLLVHDRLETERKKQLAWREKSAQGGRLSGKLRAEKQLTQTAPQTKGGSRVVQPPYQPKPNTTVFSLHSSDYSLEDTKETLGKTECAEVSAPTSPKKLKREPKAQPDDAAWLASLAADPTYKGIDVAQEHGKMARWCETNGKQPTRKRFVNWLNRCDRPMAGSASPRGQLASDTGVDELQKRYGANF
jgi:uncharacterized protein YdaU (DUF1376 family)